MDKTYQEKVEKIYEVIADKSLRPGCLIKKSIGMFAIGTVVSGGYEDVYVFYGDREIECEELKCTVADLQGYVLGSPLCFGDFIYWLENNSKDATEYHYWEDQIVSKWKDKRLSLPIQPSKDWFDLIDELFIMVTNK